MLQKFKITSCAFILFLFGFSLMTVSPVLAADGDGFTVCDNMPEAASKLTCFRDLARSLRAEVEDMTTAASSQEAAVDDAEGTKEALKLQIEEISGWLKDKDARIADLQEQLSTASSELQEKDETIADLTDRFASFEQSQAEFDATIAELQKQLSTASSELQEKDETIADLTDRFASFEQSQAEFDATIAELEEQLSTASSESQAKDETIADLTDRLAAAMEGSTQGSGAGTASDNKHLNGEGPQEHFWPCTRGDKKQCMVAELTEWRDGCEATFEAMSNSWEGGWRCRGAMREVGKE
jgi:predicted  nucleic acid-binding Zn-ribbon protein